MSIPSSFTIGPNEYTKLAYDASLQGIPLSLDLSEMTSLCIVGLLSRQIIESLPL
jgi:hypothetical protein